MDREAWGEPSRTTTQVSGMTQPHKPPFPKQYLGYPPGLESEMDPEPRYLAEEYKGSEKLAGKVALNTGGDSGIGHSVAALVAREGPEAMTSLGWSKKYDATSSR